MWATDIRRSRTAALPANFMMLRNAIKPGRHRSQCSAKIVTWKCRTRWTSRAIETRQGFRDFCIPVIEIYADVESAAARMIELLERLDSPPFSNEHTGIGIPNYSSMLV
jgi:hypothetical protein